MERNIYLENKPLDEALGKWLEAVLEEGVQIPAVSETVPTWEASGRVTAEPLFALVSSPPFHSSAMDGVAVDATKTYGATETSPVRLRLDEDIEMIDTGEPLSKEYDAVIMIEDLSEAEPGVYEIIKPVAPWQNVRPLGEDIVQTELIVPQGHRIQPVDMAALLNGGITSVPVIKKPRVVIIPTGTELVENPEDLAPGKVMESNSRALCAYVETLGGTAVRMDLVPDEFDTIDKSFTEALETGDIIVTNAGTSAGREDFTKAIIEKHGRVTVHGVAMKPGKPVILGVAEGKPVIGLPGYPVANFRGALEFLEPLVKKMLGLPGHQENKIGAKLARKIFSSPGFDEFVQVKVGRVDDQVVAVPLPRGSGASMSMVRADGVIRITPEKEGLAKWDNVEVLLHKNDVNVEGNILAIGSHDISLDILSSYVVRKNPGVSLASANVGSMGGIMAIKQGQAHIAGTHMLDPETGEFNVPYVLRQLGADEVLLVHLAWRTQGFMVLPGNPKQITGIEDLARDDIKFVNRQKGSGTRLLLDHLLGSNSINHEAVNGYERELFTHTAIAAAVASGTADTGVGLLAAAQALKLDFIPLASERYDLLMRASFKGSQGYYALMAAIQDPDFRKDVEDLGGYDTSESGKVIPMKVTNK
ncbi:MAG: molybdopterin biosynthesis protein [Actinobacteria bacterium]|nr:molybdopterin biosynthesis protein [Actinomycetota bacterium]